MTKWIIVVDDDTANLKIAGHILSKNNMRVTALKSGKSFLEYIESNGMPDLVLLDIMMPEMDGFETLIKLREHESRKGLMKTPVIFLTADEDVDTETRGFEVGVSDFIRKPFNPDVLLRRINNIMSNSQEMANLMSEASTDKLTGLFNKAATGVELSKTCSEATGCLMMIDLDSFKLVNDLYGHAMGDKVLIGFSDLIRKTVPAGSKCGRIGGDEFVAFAMGVTTEEKVKEITTRLNVDLVAMAKQLMGEGMAIPLGSSIGAIFVPRYGNDYNSLLKLADKSLYSVKKNGKHGYELYSEDSFDDSATDDLDIQSISEILGERSIQNVALQLDRDAFSHVYRYVIRYALRHHINACKVLFALSPAEGESEADYAESLDEFGTHIRDSLRKSDILMRNNKNHYFVFLTDIREDSYEKVANNIVAGWRKNHPASLHIAFSTEFVSNSEDKFKADHDKHVIVVDDDEINLQIAGKILSSDNIKVTAFRSGEALLNYFDGDAVYPDLILLDVKMPGLDGYETLKRLRTKDTQAARLPVIFLTADESIGAEKTGLSLGAMDFIRKPFVPEVLILRVNHTIELTRLQRHLTHEVEQKTRENNDLALNLVQSLVAAIDMKDPFTRGHSVRVAEYARMIASKAGYTDAKLEELYITALLHDVGKIGVPDYILLKPGRYTEEEYQVIKQHSQYGAEILSNIDNKPRLAMAAKYHHERYDGRGYPSGLSGEDIPEEARIIAVADAYDAMSSDRSYRQLLTQDEIRSELKNCIGSQFEPVFAEIMLSIMDEDPNYVLRYKKYD